MKVNGVGLGVVAVGGIVAALCVHEFVIKPIEEANARVSSRSLFVVLSLSASPSRSHPYMLTLTLTPACPTSRTSSITPLCYAR